MKLTPLPPTLFGALLPILLIALPLAGGVYAHTPEPYTWYRLYEDCDHDVLVQLSGMANQNEAAIVAAASWQAKLVVSAHTGKADRIWYAPHMFLVESARTDIESWARADGFPLYVIIDHHTIEELGAVDLSFLEGPRWHPVAMGCSEQPVMVYVYR